MDNKKKFSANIIDIAVICVIVLAVLAAGLVLKPMLFSEKDETVEFKETVVLELQKQEEYMVENIHVGDSVYDAFNNSEYGKIVSYDVIPSKETAILSKDGSIREVTVPERSDIHIKIKAKEDSEAEVGKLLEVYTKYFKASGYIISVEREADEEDKAVSVVEAQEVMQ